MFILLKNGAMFNLFWLQDCFQGKHDKNIVIFYGINGSKVTEEYDTPAEAQKRVEDIKFMMEESSAGDTRPLIVEELPTENISTRRSYLIRVSDDPDDGYQEWKYIEQEDGTFKWEMLGITKDYAYSKEEIDDLFTALRNNVLLKNGTTSYTPTQDYHPATKKYVDEAPTEKPFPSSFVTTGTTLELIQSARSANLPTGSVYLGGVRLTDMPFSGNAEVEISIYPNNVLHLVLKSSNVSPYEWECNSHSYRGWEPAGKAYADTNFLKKDNTTSYTPTADYHPATKKYVDDEIDAIPPQIFYWDGDTGSTGKAFWQHIVEVNKTSDVVVYDTTNQNPLSTTRISGFIEKNHLYDYLTQYGNCPVLMDYMATIQDATSYTTLRNSVQVINISGDGEIITQVRKSDNGYNYNLGSYLRTDKVYNVPFIPTEASQPATKKYVDDKPGAQLYTQNTSYKQGALLYSVRSTMDIVYLFVVIRDYTSRDLETDLSLGNILRIGIPNEIYDPQNATYDDLITTASTIQETQIENDSATVTFDQEEETNCYNIANNILTGTPIPR